ncbi:hypothetical protein [Leifsonia naganoensis]|jgi:hypothetical protein|uniref:ATP/GTP-binding protein n=1 Tax=Leifsonia naganoensis TaxID=150025 RepID=A0A853DTP6_9MICO|nr:hypothetical protein [Leifsonia naganoensis]NYK12078.1 hypothetical protein [Leifsonia naganoensis]
MPRSNRPRGRHGQGRGHVDDQQNDGLDRLMAGWRRTETRRGTEWNVQPVSAAQAQKSYVCPGCGRDIVPGVAHLVAWRADGVLGDSADLAARRHWHEACWKIA